MTEFIEDVAETMKDVDINEANIEVSDSDVVTSNKSDIVDLIDITKPNKVDYCPFCSIPFEFCEFGNLYESKCLPYIQENRPELLAAKDIQSDSAVEDSDEKVICNSSLQAKLC